MLKSQEIMQNILNLKTEIENGIKKNIDMTSKANELDQLIGGYHDAVKVENKQKHKENTKIMDRKSVNMAVKNLLAKKPAGVEGVNLAIVDVATGNYNGEPNTAGAVLVSEEFLPLEILNGGDIDLTTYCRTVNVNKPSGKIPTYDASKRTELANFTSDNKTEVEKKSLAFAQIPYKIDPRGAIIPVSVDLIEDANEDLIGVVYDAYHEGEVYTKNKEVLAALGTATKTIENVDFATHALVDAIKEGFNAKLPTRYGKNAKIIVSQTVFNKLSTLKNAQKDYVMQPIVTEPGKYAIEGHEVIVMDDEYSELTSAVFVADMKSILNIVRKGLEISSDYSSGFTTYSCDIRAISRFQEKALNPGAICKISATQVL